ncbi:MAG TPA: hypothetical protein VFA98_09095 [Thermoanaerobaculia bacterium]|nr:hypothetical protein [Thermoanaerobaculia bacterium]
MAPSLAVDLDGDGREETVTASPGHGVVRVTVKDAAGRQTDAKAPAPKSDVVRVGLSAGSLGSAGALLLVDAASDSGDCVSVWRLRGDRLERVPIRETGGKDAPDCFAAGAWTWQWRTSGEGRPAALVRERSGTAPQGAFTVRDAFAFAGFSLEPDAALSGREIAGVAIPTWYDAVLYSNAALEVLYSRFDLSRLRPEPTLRITADRARGAFAVRFAAPEGDVELPVTASEPQGKAIRLDASLGEKSARLVVHLGGADGTVPMMVEAAGLGAPYDQIYGPAGSYHGRAAKVFLDADDELASEELASTWIDPRGGQTTFDLAGAPPYRIRIEKELYGIDRARAEKPIDVVLVPETPTGRAWGIMLRGKNVIERTPVSCPAGGGPCRPDGPPDRLRRLGARANAP